MVIALLADPSEQCRLAALQLLSAEVPLEWRPLHLLIPAIAARFGCSASASSDSRLPADSSEDVRLAAISLLGRALMCVPDSGCTQMPTDLMSLTKLIRAERPHSELSAEEVQCIVNTVQGAMGDTWVEVRKVCGKGCTWALIAVM